jgi:hypothetical protein
MTPAKFPEHLHLLVVAATPADPAPPPPFRWFDNSSGPSTPQEPGEDYGHWGSITSEFGELLEEPNGEQQGGPPQLCAVANASQSYDSAWGWSDVACLAVNVSTICKIYREWQALKPNWEH